MEWRSGSEVTVLIMMVCGILSPASGVQRLDSPRPFLHGSSGSMSSAEYSAQRSSSVDYGQFWMDLLNAMKSIEERGDLGVTSRRLVAIGMPLHMDRSDTALHNSAYLEPLIAVDGNKSGLLLIVKEEGRDVKDDIIFTGGGMQEERPHMLYIDDPNLNRAVNFADEAQETANLNTQFEQATDDVGPLAYETTTTLSNRVSETVTLPTIEFGDKFTPLTGQGTNVAMSSAVEDKQLTLKRSNRAARVKRSAVFRDGSSNEWRAVHKPIEVHPGRLVSGGFKNPLTQISERTPNDALERSSATDDEFGITGTPANDTGIPYSLYQTLGFHGAPTKGDGRTLHPEQEAKQRYLAENHQHQHYLTDIAHGNQTYVHKEFPPVHKTDNQQTTAEETRDGKRTQENQYPLLSGVEQGASSRFVLSVPNTENEHLHYDEDPANGEVSNAAYIHDDVGKRNRIHWTDQRFVSHDDDNRDSHDSKISSVPVDTEGSPYRRSARRIWIPSLRSLLRSDIRRNDGEMERGEQSSGLNKGPTDMIDNEIEEDKLKTVADGAGDQKSVMERLLERLERCLRSLALSTLDTLEAADEATIWPGVQLVRAGGAETRRFGGQAGRDNTLLKDEDDRWAATAVDKLANLMRTHVIRLQLSPPADDDREEDSDGLRGTAVVSGAAGLHDEYVVSRPPNTPSAQKGRRIRYRHQYKHMFPLVVMGYMVMSAFLVPMGFQLMAVLSGKALLLSKMALAVAGMAGFKRLFLASLGSEYPPPPPPPVVHHDTYPVYHEHHASFVK